MKTKFKINLQIKKLVWVVLLLFLVYNYNLAQIPIVSKIEAEDYEKLGDIVLNKIRTIEGVIDTRTLTGTKFR